MRRLRQTGRRGCRKPRPNHRSPHTAIHHYDSSLLCTAVCYHTCLFYIAYLAVAKIEQTSPHSPRLMCACMCVCLAAGRSDACQTRLGVLQECFKPAGQVASSLYPALTPLREHTSHSSNLPHHMPGRFHKHFQPSVPVSSRH
ncbi:hypothetical protein MHYP_G00125300 [Metynnis hypsauchen]